MGAWAEEIQRKGLRGTRGGFPPPFRWVRHACAVACPPGAPLLEDLKALSLSQAFGKQPPVDIILSYSLWIKKTKACPADCMKSVVSYPIW